MNQFDLADFQERTGEVVASVCRQRSLATLLAQLQELADEAEQLLREHPEDRSLIACGPGCSACCVVNVAVLLPEGLAIARFLQHQGDEQVQLYMQKLGDLWNQVRGLDDEERLMVRRRCAFLDEQSCCSIYPVRPLLCRSLTSTSAASCREALAGRVMGEESAILMHQFQQELYQSLFEAVALGLEKNSLEGRSYQLSGLLNYLLRHPAAEAQWLAGDKLSWQDIY